MLCCPVLQAALSAAGIRPSNSQRYPVQDIKDAIENMYGVMPHVTCDARGALSEVGGRAALCTTAGRQPRRRRTCNCG